MLNEKRRMEGDVVFTSRYGKRKSDEDLNTSLSQLLPMLKKQRLVDIEVSETELVQTVSSLIPIGSKRMASLLARLQTVSFVPFYFSFCLIVFSFVILFWRIPFSFLS
ncbi:unnamed protein product [Trifolium pratense]|uniref:Uncharacterized protein n=1 Tax=Trifolium pratense TaxID=57577 RepID=A0ACB0LV06_TRIPR|nr:unnamed protein product [Trifolium pratense]